MSLDINGHLSISFGQSLSFYLPQGKVTLFKGPGFMKRKRRSKYIYAQ